MPKRFQALDIFRDDTVMTTCGAQGGRGSGGIEGGQLENSGCSDLALLVRSPPLQQCGIATGSYRWGSQGYLLTMKMCAPDRNLSDLG